MSDVARSEPAEKWRATWSELARELDAQPPNAGACLALLDQVADFPVSSGQAPLGPDAASRAGMALLAMIKDAKAKPLESIKWCRVIADADWMPRAQRLDAIVQACAHADIGGRPQLLLEMSEQQLSLADPEADRRLMLRARFQIAMAHYCLSHSSDALKRLNVLLAELRDDESDLVGVYEGSRASILRSIGRYNEAIAALSRAERINRASGRSYFVCGNMLMRGNILMALGDVPGALAVFEEMEQFAFVMGERPMMAVGIGAGGSALARLGRNDEAMDRYKRALQVFIEVDDQRGILFTRTNIASLHFKMGRVDKSEREFRSTAEGALANGMVACCVANLCSLVELLLDRGDLGEASQVMNRVESLAGAELALAERLIAASTRGRLLLAEGDLAQAISCLSAAVQLAEQHENYECIPRLRSQLAEARLAGGQVDAALADVQAAHEHAERHVPRDIEGLLRSSLIWAKCAQSSRDDDLVKRLALDMVDLCGELEGGSVGSVTLARDAREFVRRLGPHMLARSTR
jgi:tetratricopeptide (TPR) repeat protein